MRFIKGNIPINHESFEQWSLKKDLVLDLVDIYIEGEENIYYKVKSNEVLFDRANVSLYDLIFSSNKEYYSKILEKAEKSTLEGIRKIMIEEEIPEIFYGQDEPFFHDIIKQIPFYNLMETEIILFKNSNNTIQLELYKKKIGPEFNGIENKELYSYTKKMKFWYLGKNEVKKWVNTQESYEHVLSTPISKLFESSFYIPLKNSISTQTQLAIVHKVLVADEIAKEEKTSIFDILKQLPIKVLQDENTNIVVIRPPQFYRKFNTGKYEEEAKAGYLVYEVITYGSYNLSDYDELTQKNIPVLYI